MRSFLVCFVCMVIGCATANQPAVQTAASQPAQPGQTAILTVTGLGEGTLTLPGVTIVTDEHGNQQLFNEPACPVGCVEQYGVTNPYLLETDITYLQLTMWRFRGAVEDALKPENAGKAQTILSEAHDDVVRLTQEYSGWWDTHHLDQDCYYCGPVCQEMHLLLLNSPVTDSYPICPDTAPSARIRREQAADSAAAP